MSEETTQPESQATPEPESGNSPPPAENSGSGDEHIDWRGVAVFGLLVVGLLGVLDCILSWCGVSGAGGLGLIASAIAFGTIVHVGFR